MSIYRESRYVILEIICEELYKTSMVCIDSYENRVLCGRICNPYLEADISFRSTMEFLKEMEKLMQDLQFPQAYFENREFRPVRELMSQITGPAASVIKKGQIATFSLRIRYRQNSSWQGSLNWMEGKREESFRSVLEMLLLIDSALDNGVA